MYKTITGTTDLEGTPKDLVHNEGEVWLLDFWATWCPPCQKPMAHNEEMLKEHGEAWGDKVKIIGLSIDQTADMVKKHIETKDWKRPIHYHRAKSDCSEVYGVRGVPHVMLIDKKGMIAFKGHPANRKDLKADLDAMLAGTPLTGEGCAPENPAAGGEGGDAAAAEETKFPDGFKEGLDCDAISK